MKHKLGFALAVVTSLLVTKVEASSYWPWESDIYRGPKLPTAFKRDNILFTVPALQGMQEHKLDADTITRMINPYLSDPSMSSIREGNTVILLRRKGVDVEVSDVGQE